MTILKQIIKELENVSDETLSKLLDHIKDIKQEEDKILTHFASEKVLAKDWLTPEEDEQWKDL